MQWKRLRQNCPKPAIFCSPNAKKGEPQPHLRNLAALDTGKPQRLDFPP
jgi:hypothetical protein